MMRLNLGYQVLIAVILGILTGLFLGSSVSVLLPISTIYVMLLQMVVLPYICLSIIHGLGSLSPGRAFHLLKNGWFFLVLLWGLVFFMIFLFAYLIPQPASALNLQSDEAASLKASLTKNILTYLIPENPIYDFVNNIVPSIAVLGIIVGMALMHIEKKEPLISAVQRINQIIEKILWGLAVASPIGVFAHIAGGAGTVRVSELVQIDFYLISFIAITLLVTFCILPLILTSLTPLDYRESLKAFRMVCLLPFVTGVPTIAIPFINMYMKRIGEKYALTGDVNFRSTSQAIVPISYSFAQIGNCLLLFFILFASFYYRHPFTGSEKCLLSFLTIPLSIGSSVTSINAVTFLFKELNFPDNALVLFTSTIPVTLNFQVLMSVAAVCTFIILVLFSNFRLLQMNWKKLTCKLFITLGLSCAVVYAIYPYVYLQDSYRNFYINRSMSEAIPKPVHTQFYSTTEALSQPRQADEEVLDQILQTGVLRVGYSVGNIPYAYLNASSDLVGFDIAMAYKLAKDLNCRVEFIPVDIDHLADRLNNGVYDIAMGSILMSENRIARMSFSDAYNDQNFVLILPEKDRYRFSTQEDLDKKGVVIGAVGAYQRIVAQNFPHATLYAGTDEKGYEMDKANAWVSCRVSGSVWCFNHLDYYIDDFGGQLGKCFLAYPMRSNAMKFQRFINNWMQINILDGFYEEQNDFWILGKSISETQEPRWSVLHNILHWTD
jgi:proton glutamate symport protein